jgi:hypothetical protein
MGDFVQGHHPSTHTFPLAVPHTEALFTALYALYQHSDMRADETHQEHQRYKFAVLRDIPLVINCRAL